METTCPTVPGLKKIATRTANANRYMDELRASDETLARIVEEFGPLTLADCLYLYNAILKGEHIEFVPKSGVLAIVSRLPSAAEWRSFIDTAAGKAELVDTAEHYVDDALAQRRRADVPPDLDKVRVVVWDAPDLSGRRAVTPVVVWSYLNVALDDAEAIEIAKDLYEERLVPSDPLQNNAAPKPTYVL